MFFVATFDDGSDGYLCGSEFLEWPSTDEFVFAARTHTHATYAFPIVLFNGLFCSGCHWLLV